MKNERFHRTVVLPDCHFPNHNVEAWNAVLAFIKWFKPDRLIQLGDFCDFDSLSRFDLHHPGQFVTLNDELEAVHKALDQLDKACPKHRCEKVMIGGNHEDRYHQAKAKFLFVPDKISRSMIDWKESWANEYGLPERGWRYCEYGKWFKFGKVVYTHGWSTGKSNAASKEASHFPGSNVIFGHTHRHQVYGCIDADNNPIESETIGTLSKFDLAYLRGKPATDWVNGFMVIYARADGRFTKNFINIIGGTFIFAGKEFNGNSA